MRTLDIEVKGRIGAGIGTEALQAVGFAITSSIRDVTPIPQQRAVRQRRRVWRRAAGALMISDGSAAGTVC